MHSMPRTDLATELREIAEERSAEIPGVRSEETEREGFMVNRVEILDPRGEEAIGKPVGRYVTIDWTGLLIREQDGFTRAVRALAAELSELLPEDEERTVLVAGLGNRFITPDAVGPKAMEHILVTRHLVDQMPKIFGSFARTAAVAPGGLGLTGVETGEIIRGIVDRVKPSVVIAIDALAARRVERLCRTVQLADSGIVPGAGVGNTRYALNEESLGVPVIALGVPTVVDAMTLLRDQAESAGVSLPHLEPPTEENKSLIVTPKDIDRMIADSAKTIGYGINLALNPELSMSDMEMLLS